MNTSLAVGINFGLSGHHTTEWLPVLDSRRRRSSDEVRLRVLGSCVEPTFALNHELKASRMSQGRKSSRATRGKPARGSGGSLSCTLDSLRSDPWPGNIRELQNVIERSVIVSDTDEFAVDESWLSTRPQVDSRFGLSGTVAAHEKATIEDALRATGGRVAGSSGAAARLGIPRSTLESKIRVLRINKRRFRPGKETVNGQRSWCLEL